MELTHESIAGWLDGYLKDVARYQGPIDNVRKLRDYFTPDFQFLMYTGRAPDQVLSRDGLLLLFVNAGFREALSPNYYVIDVKRLIAVAQLEVSFTELSSGTKWPPIQASAHYHLVLDDNGNLKIRKIQYWTQIFTPDIYGSLFPTWEASRQKGLVNLATEHLNR